MAVRDMRDNDENAPWFLQVLEAELEYIRRRRNPEKPDASVKDTLVGLSLSGGGIRSATTNLGILQALSRMGILPLVDYLCTVSGGGYIGSCLSSLLSLHNPAGTDESMPRVVRRGDRPLFSTAWDTFPFRPDTPLGGGQIRHLRTHGSFLVTRKGLLKRETMRSVGNLLSGTMYHLSLVFLALIAAALLYLSLLFFQLPTVDPALRALTGPVAAYATAYEARTVGSEPPKRDPATSDGRVTVSTPPATYIQSTVFSYPGLWDIVRAKSLQLLSDLRDSAETHWVAVLATALFGWLVAAVSFVVLGLRGSPIVMPGAGESGEDAAASRMLRIAGYGSVVALVVWLGAMLGLTPTPGVLWLLLPVIAVAALRFLTWLLHVCLPRLGRLWSRQTRSLWGAYQAMATYALWFTVLLAIFPVAVYALREYTAWVGISGVASLVVARAVTFRRGPDAKKKPLTTSALRWLLGVAIGLGLFLVLVALCAFFIPDEVPPDIPAAALFTLIAGGICMGMLCLLGFTGDANRLSPHYFYRDRLAEAYLYTDRRVPDLGLLVTLRDNIELSLKDLHYDDANGPAAPTAPYHLISCAINLAASRDLTRKDRKSGYFLFSRFFCGSTHTKYVDTATYHGGDVRVARAITISGAAASSGIGAGTFFAQAFATVLFNLRLGYWMRHPLSRPRGLWKDVHFWPRWLWREMVMDTHERAPLVNLSDGGHTGDNVGIYPLLQRQCRLIIACDAEADAKMGFGSFTEALRHAYIDLGIDVDIDLTMVRPDPDTGMSRSHSAVGLIRYPGKIESERRIGYLVYLKNSLTGDEPEPVLNYKSTHATFPHESTVDQFFDDAQFESYRTLGHHIAEHAFAHWIHTGAFDEWRQGQQPLRRDEV